MIITPARSFPKEAVRLTSLSGGITGDGNNRLTNINAGSMLRKQIIVPKTVPKIGCNNRKILIDRKKGIPHSMNHLISTYTENLNIIEEKSVHAGPDCSEIVITDFPIRAKKLVNDKAAKNPVANTQGSPFKLKPSSFPGMFLRVFPQ